MIDLAITVDQQNNNISTVIFPPSVPIREKLLVQRSKYLCALYRYTDPAAKTQTLDKFQYPDGAPFTAAEFKFTLLVLNAVPSRACLFAKIYVFHFPTLKLVI